ncbi:MAG: DNA primase [Clostridia bacterium]
MQKLSDEFINELKMRCDIEQFISSYIQLKRRGKNLVGLCPFHNERTPSFTVYPENQSYYCFGCGSGGTVINFAMNIENLGFMEAVQSLCDRVGMNMPTDNFDDSLAKKRKRMYQINKEAAKFFHQNLFIEQGQIGLNYYFERGYSKKTIVHFGMGYAQNSWDSLLKHMRTLGYSYEELYEANLANKSTKNDKIRYYDSFRNRVMIPIIDVRGNVVAFGGRILDDSKPKYINTSDTLVYKKSLGVFGLNFAKNTKEDSLILVEGYMDAISLHQAGFTNTVACLGTALTGDMARLLSRYSENIILSYDADEAGQKATQKAIDVFSSIGIKIRVVKLRGGKDPDEILKKYGAERFRTLITGAANDVEYQLLKIAQQFDIESDDGKMKYLEAACECLAKTKNNILQEIYATRISAKVGIPKDTLLVRIESVQKKNFYNNRKTEFKKIEQNTVSQNHKISISTGANVRVIKAQEMILASLMKNPTYLKLLENEISANDFSLEPLQRIFAVIEEKIKDERNLEISYFAGDLNSEQMSQLMKILKNHENLSGSEKEFLDCMSVIKEEKNKLSSGISVAKLSDEEYIKLFDKKN